jgi:hypothetical protein
LGQEWVPIREENLPFSPAVNAIELGTSFNLSSTTTFRDARFYTTDLPAPTNSFQTALVNVYPAGLEASTGPIQQVIIPVAVGLVTGGNITVTPGGNVAAALAQPGSDNGITFGYNSGNSQRVGLWFNVSSAGPMLANKRILNVSLLYAGALGDFNALGVGIPFVNPNPVFFTTIVEQRNDGGTDIDFVGPAFISNTGSLAQLATIPGTSGSSLSNQVIGVLNLGDVNNFWDPAIPPTSSTDTSRMPWRYVDLLRFEPTFGANRQMIRITFQIPQGLPNAFGVLDYVAMRVIYCEETRVAYGAKRFRPYKYGTNIITMRDLLFVPDPTLSAGSYTATLSWVNPGEVDYDDSLKTSIPDTNGLRELYQIPSHPGVEIDIPFPLAERLGETFTKVESHVLPQLSLHGTTGAPLVEPHVYGRQAVAQVYGTKTATQDILYTPSTAAASYPWVRYIARRFGDTSVPLTFTAGGQSASITVDEFNALDEILDGWKEVTLRLPAAMELASMQDTFTRSVANSWGTTDTGQTYNTSNSTMSVNGTKGVMTHSAVGTNLDNILLYSASDFDMYFDIDPINGTGTGTANYGVLARLSGTNWLSALVFYPAGATPTCAMNETINGVAVSTSAFPAVPGVAAGGAVRVRFQAIGKQLRMKAYSTAAAEPDAWLVELTITQLTTPGTFDFISQIPGTFTNTPPFNTLFDNFLINPFPFVTWSATGELAGNRWEVLGACAPAVSGVPGSSQTFAPLTQRLDIATYGQPVSGAPINLGWITQGVGSPWVTGTTDDTTSDAFVIFAQDMPMVTGFSVTTLSQAVSGIGQQCGLDPCCIPTDILYNRITWGLPAGTGYASDSFERTVAPNSWGNADTGQAWTEDTGSSTTWSVSDGHGRVNYVSGSVNRTSTVDIGGFEQDITTEFFFDSTYPPNTNRVGLAARFVDTSNYYIAVMNVSSAGVVQLEIAKIVAGVFTTLETGFFPLITAGVSAKRFIRFQVIGTTLSAKLWTEESGEPANWQVTTTDSTFTTGTKAGVYVRINVSGDFNVSFDNFALIPPAFNFGYYELQRMDSVETDWKSIMRATGTWVTEFNDYEARTAIQSSYRIRGVDVYDFPGPWSSTITATIPSPGVSGGDCLDTGHILIFTSNEHQDGSINLAYSTAWMGSSVEEDFVFPEAGFVQLQLMYNKDFVTAFRPLERGGERFSRTLLVQAAAIAPETLADFRSLRDMAWDAVNYICVRDEDGNRWFATVLVPSGRVLRDRRLYLAPVEIIETNDAPTPVDPTT